MDDKQSLLFILGIVIFALLYRITYTRIYNTEGIADPFAGIKKFIKQISDMVAEILFFICYMGEVLKWMFKTVECMFAAFVPLYCPLIRVIDMFISLVGFIIGSVMRVFGLGIMIDTFNSGCKGIDYLTDSAVGIKITDWHSWMGIDKKCYKCKFPPFPKPKKNKKK